MKKFIKSIINEKDIMEFKYKEYNTLFVKEEYNMFYLFFFIKDGDELVKLKEESADLYKTIKNNKKVYRIDMDKNITCIYCLSTKENEYYDTEQTGTISELSKKICLVEEDLNFFKKNVLLYTDEMKKFANSNVGKFDILCKKMITDKNFQKYKKSNVENYQYELLINLFIKLPFLNFKKYQLNNEKEYKSLESFINEEYNKEEINKDYIYKQIKILDEKINDENMLYEWLDELGEPDNGVKKSDEVIKDEN